MQGNHSSLVTGSYNKAIGLDDSMMLGQYNNCKCNTSIIGGGFNITQHFNVNGLYNTDLHNSVLFGSYNIIWTDILSNMILGDYLTVFSEVSGSNICGAFNSIYASLSNVTGTYNKSKGPASTVEGSNNTVGLALREQAFNSSNVYIGPSRGEKYTVFGYASHAEGQNNIVGTSLSHAEGNNNQVGDLETRTQTVYTSSGSFVESYQWLKQNTYDITKNELNQGKSFGESSHVEGSYNVVLAHASHAEGIGTLAGTSVYDPTYSGLLNGYVSTNKLSKGLASHAEGIFTKATGTASSAGGLNTEAPYDFMTAIGKYNNPQSNSIFEVGVGSSSSPLNGLRVNILGYVYADQETIPIISNSVNGKILVTREYLDDPISGVLIPDFGITGGRPTTTQIGYPYFDTTLGYIIWWNGTDWVNSTGATV